MLEENRGLDFLALTETWDRDRPLIKGYDVIIKPGTKKEPKVEGTPTRGRVSGGIAFLYKDKYKNNLQNVPTESKHVLIIKITGFVRSLFIFIVYWQPCLKDLNERIEKLKDQLYEYSKLGNTILVGDFNARTGHESYDYKYKPRKNVDLGWNKQGKSFMNLCKSTRHIILNGRRYGDLMGCTTYHGCGYTTTVDYIASDGEMFDLVEYMYVHPHIKPFSDHCLLEVCFEKKINITQSEQNKGDGDNSFPFHYKSEERVVGGTCRKHQTISWRMDALMPTIMMRGILIYMEWETLLLMTIKTMRR